MLKKSRCYYIYKQGKGFHYNHNETFVTHGTHGVTHCNIHWHHKKIIVLFQLLISNHRRPQFFYRWCEIAIIVAVHKLNSQLRTSLWSKVCNCKTVDCFKVILSASFESRKG
ncbi:unnamed protein product [Haemonchus placei]|uniref:Uncharacterized protein n=1 Tax=Haemonchus placei TaxID=6290 RepID=A0A3P7WKU4_HAEPC|nr:unnamed protein product [Haemonchus placei]